MNLGEKGVVSMLSDPLFLSRLQFVWVIAWHILLPAFTVGLASYIAVLEGVYFATGREVYFRSSMFWIKIFFGLIRDGRGLRNCDPVNWKGTDWIRSRTLPLMFSRHSLLMKPSWPSS